MYKYISTNVQIIILSLQVLGRQSIEVRICACPGRDRKVDERTAFPERYPAKKTTLPTSLPSTLPAGALKRKRPDGVEEFTLTITGRENYEILLKIKESLELASLIKNSGAQPLSQIQNVNTLSTPFQPAPKTVRLSHM